MPLFSKSSTPSKQVLVVGGITLNIYSQSKATTPDVPVTIMFLIHGRNGSAERMEGIAHSTLEAIHKQRKASRQPAQDLMIVTFDQRNHGTRLVDKHANQGWSDDASKNNIRHAIDMYTVYTGTAQDVSYLIDFLPSYLFPAEERTISQWLVAGKSLGGHSAWLTLRNDPRVKIGIPIIGCPDYLTLISKRAKAHSLPFGPPYIPKSLADLIKQADPAAAPYTTADASNPFLGKKILVLSGKDDRIVPWSASKDFVENLNVGAHGVKKVVVHPGVGHECTDEMVQEMAAFIWNEALI